MRWSFRMLSAATTSDNSDSHCTTTTAFFRPSRLPTSVCRNPTRRWRRSTTPIRRPCCQPHPIRRPTGASVFNPDHCHTSNKASVYDQVGLRSRSSIPRTSAQARVGDNPAYSTVIKTFLCPSAPGQPAVDYSAELAQSFNNFGISSQLPAGTGLRPDRLLTRYRLGNRHPGHQHYRQRLDRISSGRQGHQFKPSLGHRWPVEHSDAG